ncbi:MAG: hypothetical protein HKP05_05070 [Woeseiaceae bacterium]|nr:hypothetical protein [Gammaproteobacteria bacterium]NNK25008.1 hypothetical protein [Woeseiaceae bacterium]
MSATTRNPTSCTWTRVACAAGSATLKKALAYIPIVLSFLLLGAHFLRDGAIAGVAASLLIIGLLFLRRPWVARLAQVALVAATIVWAFTLYDLVQMRATLGLPYTRMAIILGSVSAMAMLSTFLFQTRLLRDVYRLE